MDIRRSSASQQEAGRPRLSSAARLLVAIDEQGSPSLDQIAQRLGLPLESLEECRDGTRPLALETQMYLAALITELAPEHRRLATSLYSQAQAALRGKLEPSRQHPYYHKGFTG